MSALYMHGGILGGLISDPADTYVAERLDFTVANVEIDFICAENAPAGSNLNFALEVQNRTPYGLRHCPEGYLTILLV